MTTDYQDRVRFGLVLTPQENDDFLALSCEPTSSMDVQCALNNKNAILNRMPASGDAVLGNEDIQMALEANFAYIDTLESVPGDKAVILVGDGGTTCGTDFDQTADLVASYAAEDIFTYVIAIGSPTGTFSTNMNKLADAGGKPVAAAPANRYYDASDTSDFTPIMDDIIGDTFSCVLALPAAPPNPEEGGLTVEVDGTEFELVDNCATEDGFVYSVEYTEVTLCGAACDGLKATGNAEAKYYCIAG